MASLPPRPRRSSPRENATTSELDNSQLLLTNSEAHSTTSEDPQTVLLNAKSLPSPSDGSAKLEDGVSPSQHLLQLEDHEPRKCWICFEDETEDTPLSSEWRSPCPCALTAHESCLLDWVADIEAPKSGRQAGKPAKILCPQCKNEIVLARPRSLIVDGVRTIEKLTSALTLPGVGFVACYTLYAGCFMHGVSTVYAIFGLEDGYRILEPLYEPHNSSNTWFIATAFRQFKRHWRLTTGLAIVPPILIASRTTAADSILPVLPLLFLATAPESDDSLRLQWPPSAAVSFAILPYIRAVYNAYYEKIWSKRERSWLRQIQPRAGERLEDHDIAAVNQPEEDGLDLQIDIDINIIDDWRIGDDRDAQGQIRDEEANGNRAPPLHAPPLDARDDVQDAAPAAPAVVAGDAPAQAQNRRNDMATFSTARIADTVLGALIFPTLAAAMGELLRLALPRSWTTSSPSGKSSGFLQTRWGRSIVGGCTFVAAKDAILLYVRWKMAQNHRKRRILNYDKSKGRVMKD